MDFRPNHGVLLRLLLSASLLTALLFAQPAHDHSPLSAPDVCVPCTWSLHAPTVVAATAAPAILPTISVTIAIRVDAVPASRTVTTARPRSPPFA